MALRCRPSVPSPIPPHALPSDTCPRMEASLLSLSASSLSLTQATQVSLLALLQSFLDPGTQVGGRSHSSWPQGVEQAGEGRGSGEGILGWHRRVISAYTWCVTEKGPQRRWLHKIGKAETPECLCQYPEQSGRHTVEGCEKLTEARKEVEKEAMEE